MSIKKNKKKKSFKPSFSTILIFIGILIFTYPFIAQGYKSLQDTKIVRDFKNNKLKGNSLERFNSKMKDYNDKVAKGAFNSNASNIDFDGNEDTQTPNEDNQSVIDPSSILDASGEKIVIGTIIIPKIDEEIPIYYGSDHAVLQKGVGLLENTSYPTLKETSVHSVLTAHRGTHDAKLFRDLDKLDVGDNFYIQLNDDIIKYNIYEYLIVDPSLVQQLTIEEGRNLATLVTCHPFLINTERILAKGEQTPMTKADYELLGLLNDNSLSIKDIKSMLLFYGLILVDLLLLLLLIYLFIKNKKEEKNNKNRSENTIEKNI